MARDAGLKPGAYIFPEGESRFRTMSKP